MNALPIAILCGLLFGALGVLATVWTVISALHGDFLTAVATLGFSMFCIGFIVPFAKAVPGRINPRGQFDELGTTIRPDRGVDGPIQVSLLGLFIGGGMFAVLAPLDKLDIPVPREMRLYLPFVAGVAAILAALTVWRTLRRGSSKYILLTPSGFEIAQGWRLQAGDWADVKDITDSAPDQPAATSGAVVFVMSDGSSQSIAAASITPDGHSLRRLVDFYWQHPADRSELTDGRALRRLANEQFDVA
ncbi:MAG: hypothetical protein QOD90_2464 [Mycobacterium sp.]|jgi:hypothetical protein|nr:hypothetical protein [Mycobacterium sp.]